jgi:hypothetical protein
MDKMLHEAAFLFDVTVLLHEAAARKSAGKTLSQVLFAVSKAVYVIPQENMTSLRYDKVTGH